MARAKASGAGRTALPDVLQGIQGEAELVTGGDVGVREVALGDLTRVVAGAQAGRGAPDDLHVAGVGLAVDVLERCAHDQVREPVAVEVGDREGGTEAVTRLGDTAYLSVRLGTRLLTPLADPAVGVAVQDDHSPGFDCPPTVAYGSATAVSERRRR